MPTIHPLAIVEKGAELASDVEVGPFCTVGKHVVIGPRTKLVSHVVVMGHTTLGADNLVYPYSVLGAPPQDLKWNGEPTRLEVGNGNRIREGVSMHVGTVQDHRSGGTTRVGSGNLLMAGMHVGHDCQLGSGCIVANGSLFAGHVVVGDNAVVQGGVGVSHFVTLGKYCYVAGGARIVCDVPPFVKVDETGRMITLNRVRLARCGFPPDAVGELARAVRGIVRGKKPISVAVAELLEQSDVSADVRHLAEFLHRRTVSKNGRYLEANRGV